MAHRRLDADDAEWHLLGAAEAAEYLTISPRWLRELAARGDIKHLRLSGRRVYLRGELRRWERERPLVGRPAE